LLSLALQAQLFIGLVWMWLYVHWIYVWTSFMVGYNKARKGKGSKPQGAGAASGSKKEPAYIKRGTKKAR